MEVKATSKYVRVAPNKARQVIRHIKGLDIDEARRVLDFSPKDIALQIRKTLDSAVANAEHNEDLDADDLVVTSVIVDEGPTLRRFQPRAMGRAYRIRKRTSHITVRVGLREPALALQGAPPPAVAPAPASAPTDESAEAPADEASSDDADVTDQDEVTAQDDVTEQSDETDVTDTSTDEAGRDRSADADAGTESPDQAEKE